MHKFIKAFFVATVVLLAVGTPPMAKQSDVHNKAPGIEKAKDVSPLTLTMYAAPVMDEMYALDVFPAPAVEYAVIRTNESYPETTKSLGVIKSPDERWCKETTTTNENTRKINRWKDIHRRSC